MNKRSFWQRGNRGFLLTMILLTAVLMYVTVTQILLAQEKAAIREISEQVTTIAVDALEMPLTDMQALQKDKVKAAAYKDSLKKKLAPLFVEDAAYLDDAAGQIMTMLSDAAINEQELTSIEKIDNSPSIRIDEDVAAVYLDALFDTEGSWSVYDQKADDMVTKSQSLELWIYGDISFMQKNEEWKIYRINNIAYHTYTEEG